MGRRRRRVRGSGWKDWLSKGKAFLQKHNILSKGAAMLAPHAGSYGSALTKAGEFAKTQGYGRRKRRGGALRPAGMGRRRKFY